jgi:DNA repair protein RadD
MESLPPLNSGFVYGDDAQACGGKYQGRKAVIDAYRNRKFRYLVSVGTLTTGFDVTHTAIIAMLRRTESAALFQQIMGRAWRLDPDKTHSLLLDYAGNVDNHFPDGDIYKPVIRASIKKEGGEGIECECPMCGGMNTFGARPNPTGYGIDNAGYFVDLAGQRIDVPDVGPMPAHYGRRCFNLLPIGGGKLEQCQYRYTSKECPHCQEPNDIAARYCTSCKGEIVDPNAKLAVEFRALKRSPYNRQCDEVLKCETREGVSGSGKPTIRVDFVTPYRSFSIWLQAEPKHPQAYADLERWKSLAGVLPKTVEYQKEQSGFFRVFSYNKPADIDPSVKVAAE